MKREVIDFETFNSIISYLIMYDELSDQVDNISKKICPDFPPLNLFGLSNTFEEYILELLKFIFDDESDWIAYWIYDLEYGQKYKEGCVTNADGSIVKLETVQELYNMLLDNLKSKMGE